MLYEVITINRLVLHDTTVNLERRKDGSATWDFAPKEDPTAMTGPAMTAKPEAAAGPAPKIAIRGIDIKNTKVNLADAMTGQTLAVEVKTLTAEASNFVITSYSIHYTKLYEGI